MNKIALSIVIRISIVNMVLFLFILYLINLPQMESILTYLFFGIGMLVIILASYKIPVLLQQSKQKSETDIPKYGFNDEWERENL